MPPELADDAVSEEEARAGESSLIAYLSGVSVGFPLPVSQRRIDFPVFGERYPPGFDCLANSGIGDTFAGGISSNRDFHVFIICLSQFILLYSLVFRVKFYKF